jgi:hypothetical protein
MKRVIIPMIAIGVALSFMAINVLGWIELRLKCSAEVSNKDGEHISSEDVFLIVRYPHRFNFLKSEGTASIEVKGQQFSGSVRRSDRVQDRDMLFFDPQDSQGFDGSVSLISYSASIWDWQHFYDMKCDVR